jgi:hypothetical protein
MEFVVMGVVVLVLYGIVERLRDDGSRKAEGSGIRANRRD